MFRHAGILYRLPSSWNLLPFCPGYDTAGQEGTPGSFIGVLHFTCILRQHKYQSLDSFGRWGWLVQFYAHMRWEWLNEGRTEQRMLEQPPVHTSGHTAQTPIA